jgi:hypothetical protein
MHEVNFREPICSSKEIQSVQAVFFHSCRNWKYIQIEKISCGGKPTLFTKISYERWNFYPRRNYPLVHFIKSHNNTAAPRLNQFKMDKLFFSFFNEMNLQHFSLNYFNPASIISHLKLSIMIGTRYLH